MGPVLRAEPIARSKNRGGLLPDLPDAAEPAALPETILLHVVFFVLIYIPFV